MAGAKLHIRGDLDPIKGFLEKAHSTLDNPVEMFDEIGDELTNTTRARINAGRNPDGGAHPPVHRGGTPLFDTGAHLRDSITWLASNSGVQVGSNWEHAGVHQFGATIKAKNSPRLLFRIGDQVVSKKSVTIPARPFLGLSDLDINNVEEIVQDHLERAAT